MGILQLGSQYVSYLSSDFSCSVRKLYFSSGVVEDGGRMEAYDLKNWFGFNYYWSAEFLGKRWGGSSAEVLYFCNYGKIYGLNSDLTYTIWNFIAIHWIIYVFPKVLRFLGMSLTQIITKWNSILPYIMVSNQSRKPANAVFHKSVLETTQLGRCRKMTKCCLKVFLITW